MARGQQSKGWPLFNIRGMATILSMKKKFDALDTDMIAFDSVFETKEVAAEFNAEQINKGLKADGTVMPDYSRASVEVYGKPEGPIRLRETGAFQAGFFVTVQGDRVVFDSTDPKRDMLIDGTGSFQKQFGKTGLEGGYGPEVFGLNADYKKEYVNEAVRLVFGKKIEAATGLIMK